LGKSGTYSAVVSNGVDVLALSPTSENIRFRKIMYTKAKLVRMAEIDGLIYRKKLSNEITLRYFDGTCADLFLEKHRFFPVQIYECELEFWHTSCFVTRLADELDYEIYGLTADGWRQVSSLVKK
jgi:hypothetical protein